MNVQNKLLNMEKSLRTAIKINVFADNWKNHFPNHSGVYVIWKGDSPVYVGESSGLQSRMKDLRRPINHAFTKKMQLKTRIESLDDLRSYIRKRYTISFITVDLGRAELEEYLILRWRRTLINKPTLRLLQGQQYLWVDPE